MKNISKFSILFLIIPTLGFSQTMADSINGRWMRFKIPIVTYSQPQNKVKPVELFPVFCIMSQGQVKNGVGYFNYYKPFWNTAGDNQFINMFNEFRLRLGDEIFNQILKDHLAQFKPHGVDKTYGFRPVE